MYSFREFHLVQDKTCFARYQGVVSEIASDERLPSYSSQLEESPRTTGLHGELNSCTGGFVFVATAAATARRPTVNTEAVDNSERSKFRTDTPDCNNESAAAAAHVFSWRVRSIPPLESCALSLPAFLFVSERRCFGRILAQKTCEAHATIGARP